MLKEEKVKLLDCTLRDGGYINNWEFSEESSINIINSLIEANIEIIECGFLSQTKGKDANTSLYKEISLMNNLLSKTNAKKSKNMFVAMINLGEYNIEDLPDYDTKKHFISGLRLAFHKKDIDLALEAAKEITKKKYKLFVQPMVTPSYSDEEILNLIKKFEKIDPYAFYIVDSFGMMSKEAFRHYFTLFNNNLKKNTILGFHSHNNKQLSYSMAMDFLNLAEDRDIIIDSSIFGMGRGAGNLNTELFSDFLNQKKKYSKNYKIISLLQIIDNYLEDIYKEKTWGYSVAHFLSASMGCHPNYATYLINKKNLSVVSIQKILESLNPDKKIGFCREHAEEKYFEYKKNRKIEPNFDKKLFEDKDVLVLAPGKSIVSYHSAIDSFIKSKKPIIVSVNHCPEMFKADYYFFSNQKRYDEFIDQINSNKLIVTTNIDLHSKHEKCKIADFAELVSKTSVKSDNVTILLMNLLCLCGLEQIYIAGFDGYNVKSSGNFSYKEHGRVLDKNQMIKENEIVGEAVSSIAKSVHLNFLTPSLFQQNLSLKILGVIPARYKSSRFEGKPLALINGIPMIKRTYLQSIKSKMLDKVVVATDDKKIYNFCVKEKIPVVMTSLSCSTGTDRVAEVADKMPYDFYVNIQGDEPVISPENIDKVVGEFKKFGEEYVAYNLYKEISDTEASSDSIIKVIVNQNDELMYMSRNKIPFNRSSDSLQHLKQVCIYGFTKKALDIFKGRKKTKNEQFEDIEILRFLDLGHSVKMIKTDFDSISVDKLEDVEKVEEFLNKKGQQ